MYLNPGIRTEIQSQLNIQHETFLESLMPVPLRTLLLIFLFLIFFATNISILDSFQLPLNKILDTGLHLASQHFYSIFFSFIAVVLIPNLLLHQVLKFNFTIFGFENSPFVQWEPSIIFLASTGVALTMLVNPFDTFYKDKRYSLLRALGRLFFEGFQSPVYFCDVLLADVLTSYSRVLGDFFASGWAALFFNFDRKQNAALWSDVLTPLVVAIPFMIRLRQCVAEYLNSDGLQYRHLANALKYASAFPVIMLSPIVGKLMNVDKDHASASPATWLYYIWLLAVTFNSCYSFYWDLVMDWDLGHFSTEQDILEEVRTKPMLRNRLVFVDPALYYLVIAINFFLRITWTFKLSRQVNINEAPFGDFIIELLELFRRFLWLFLRIEKEYIHTIG